MSDSVDLKQQLESERQKRIELEQQVKILANKLNEGKLSSWFIACNTKTQNE